MNNHEAQKILIDSIQNIVDASINRINTTNSVLGVVVERPLGYDAIVEMNGERFSCLLPENLHSWIQKNDIVIVQDLYNDGRKLVITGKTGVRQETPSLVFEDEQQGKLISGVDAIFDENDELIETEKSILE